MKKELFILILLALIGGFLRFYNLNWDSGYFFHPDERNIANSVARIHFFEQLNPGFFAYGGFLIYLYRVTGNLLVFLTGDNSWVSNWVDINLIGRFYSAFFSTLTIPVIFILTREVFNNKSVALFSAFIATFTVFFIQTAHFGVTESFLGLSAILVTFLTINLFRQPTVKNYLKLGIILGLAVAAKITALSFIIFPLVAHHLTTVKRYLLFLILLVAGIITFAIFSPYTFLSWNKFLESMKYESGVATGSLPVPYTLQFTNTTPYLFQIKNFFWQIGPITLLGILGFVLMLIYTMRTKKLELFILISFPLIYFLYVGSWHTKFIRFMLPLLPFLIIFASWLLFEFKAKIKLLGNILIVIFSLLTIFWALAFFSIYTKEQTRISASRWIYDNIPLGSKILTEHWDDGLPVALNFSNVRQYKIEQLTIYGSDNQQKINYFADRLSSADYIVINSRRLYGTLMYLPEKYPVTSKYYKLLFDGQLGYKKVAEFTSYPSLFGVEINDDASEETFQVYDHPKVIVFKNVSKLARNQLLELLK